MGIFDIFRKKKPAQAQRRAERGFAAAQISRLTASLSTSSQSIDWELRLALPILRARSRELTVNNETAAKFMQMVSTHVVGPNGFSLQVRVKEPDMKGGFRQDQLASTAIEKAFDTWCKPGNCDVTGQLSFFDIQNLFIKAVARDGEVLIRKVYGNEAGPHGFQLQILDIERLDEKKNEYLSNGNVIKMGVELNQFGRPIAYHIRSKHPGDSFPHTNTGDVHQRILAEDVYHCFMPHRPEQTRGIPWLHSTMIRLQNLGGYEEAAVIAARVGAAKMGFFTTPDGDGTLVADEKAADGNLYTSAEAGEFGVLPQGYDFKPFDPDYPHAMYGDFVKANLRGVASGLGVSYNTLSNDLEGVNFSSIRTGVLEERDNWMVIQRWMIEKFLNDVFSTWLGFALLKKAVVMPNGSALPAAKFEKFNQALWQGRRWQWVDPEKDVNANVTAISNGLKCRADVIAEQGKDLDDVFNSLLAEQEKIEALGLKLSADMVIQAAMQQQSPKKPSSGGGG
jgi:lambda family phage portal protein